MASSSADYGSTAEDLGRRLKPIYRSLAGVDPRVADVSGDLVKVYPSPDSEVIVERKIRPFVAKHEDAVRSILSAYKGDSRAPAVLGDAAVLVLLERIDQDRFALQAHWPLRMQIDLYERISCIWGTPFPRR